MKPMKMPPSTAKMRKGPVQKQVLAELNQEYLNSLNSSSTTGADHIHLNHESSGVVSSETT